MASVFPEGPYLTTPFILANTSEATVYTVRTNAWFYLTQMVFADDAGEARTVTVKFRISGVDYTFVFQAAIAINVPLTYETMPIQLASADSIKVTGSAAGIHGFISGVEAVRTGRL